MLSRLTKPFRILAILAVTFLVIIAIGLYFWRPIAVEIMRQQSLAEFRHHYSTGNEWHLIKADMDWVFTFGGSRSLSELRRLSTDSSLDPAGRHLAAKLVKYIEAGEHVRDFEMIMDPDNKASTNWLQRQRYPYICEQDRHLRPKDVQS